MKNAIFTTKIEEIVYNTNDAGESFSSVSLNPTYAWIKFILTTDQANANKQRIPKDEFANLVKTGIFAPIKKAVGEIEDDHSNALPLGVITHLKENETNTEGMAALWIREREDDINMLREMYKNGNLPQLSWEILYQESSVDGDGIEDLHGCSLRAATIVGMPAYAGTTPIFAMASKNTNSEGLTVEELEQLKLRVKELEDALSAKSTEFTTLTTEVEDLRQYKKTVEEEKAAIAKFEQIKKKFSEAKLEKSDEYFSDKKSFLLGLDDTALDFMIQELVSFSSQHADAAKKTEIPNFQNSEPALEKDPVKLANALKERLTKK